ncbi:hypothetical protein [Streptomyces chryseus]|uniref:hypothetical protein n=1 Tax=Streptomyces chryseus TaxID=68186 RepID=UPI00110FA937|nr:hypothetical protein [Streptomyces chryseus]GGW99692.1 hypothetical protein GCM10010353_14220 [Streptomyces chryseus]
MITPYPPSIVTQAITLGILGDQDAGCALLQPLVNQGPQSTYVLLGMLAEAASLAARMENGPGTFYGLEVTSALDGSTASADDLPAPLRFATQFATVWANGDRDQARALFDVFAGEADRTGSRDLGQAIGIVYGMAVATGEHLVAERTRSR